MFAGSVPAAAMDALRKTNRAHAKTLRFMATPLGKPFMYRRKPASESSAAWKSPTSARIRSREFAIGPTGAASCRVTLFFRALRTQRRLILPCRGREVRIRPADCGDNRRSHAGAIVHAAAGVKLA